MVVQVIALTIALAKTLTVAMKELSGLVLLVSLSIVLSMVLAMVLALLSVWELAFGLSLELYAVPAWHRLRHRRRHRRRNRKCSSRVTMDMNLTMIPALHLPLP